MHAGIIINRLRRAMKWSQRELAERIGISRTYLAQVESGRRDPGLVMLRDAAKELDVPVALLLAGDSSPDDKIHAELRTLLMHVLDAREQVKGS